MRGEWLPEFRAPDSADGGARQEDCLCVGAVGWAAGPIHPHTRVTSSGPWRERWRRLRGRMGYGLQCGGWAMGQRRHPVVVAHLGEGRVARQHVACGARLLPQRARDMNMDGVTRQAGAGATAFAAGLRCQDIGACGQPSGSGTSQRRGAGAWRRGFIRDRPLVHNIGMLDAAACCAGMCGGMSRLAGLTRSGFLAAFPECVTLSRGLRSC